MTIVMNPGSGPVAEATEEHAAANIKSFVEDLHAEGIADVADTERVPEADDGGRYAFLLRFEDDRSIEVDMPGLPLEQVRWMGLPGQDIWEFPRLYVGGSSWIWRVALNVCRREDEDEL